MIQIKTLPQNPGTVEGGHFSYLFLKKKEQGKANSRLHQSAGKL